MKLGLHKKLGLQVTIGAMLCAVPLFAATETLFSNWTFAVSPTGAENTLWVFSRGDAASGVTQLKVKVGGSGSVQVAESKQDMVPGENTAVQDGIFTDDLAEHRRISVELAGPLGWVLPRFEPNDDGNYLQPSGFLSIRNVTGNGIIESPLVIPPAAEDLDSAMFYATSGFAYDSVHSVLWIARGMLGVEAYDVSHGANDPRETIYVFDKSKKQLEKLKENSSADLKKYTAVFDVKIHPETGDLWLATAAGLWVRGDDGSMKSASKALDTTRVTGVWIGGEPLQIIAETSKRVKESIKGGLWRRYGSAKDFAKVDFLDTAKKVVKKDVYDNSDYTVNNVAFVGSRAFVCVRAVAASVSGILKLDSVGVLAYEGDDGNAWLYDSDMGITDRNADVMSIATFPMSHKAIGLALATYGNGISVSADTGATWTTILNRAKLNDNLGSIRMVPSVITAGGESLVSYKVGKDSKITIEVFSYDMKKVRTIVKSEPRFADASRSTNAKEDFWDGKDDYGRACTMGIYYVRVKDNHDHVGWGKVMTLGGGK